MSTIIGALLDVSGSMKNSIGDGVDVKGGTWARSIFRVANDLVKYDVSSSNYVFVIGFGSRYSFKSIFDLVSTVRQCQFEGGNDIPSLDLDISAEYSTINDIFSFLEMHGAYSIRRWAAIQDVMESVSEYIAKVLLRKLQSDREFAQKFVENDLPEECRDWQQDNALSYAFQGIYAFAVTKLFRTATKEEIKEVIAKALIKDLSHQSVCTVQKAANVFQGCEERDLTSQRVQKLMKIVEPFIYGATPLYSALRKASNIFKKWDQRIPDHKRLLFLLSDGEPSDWDSITFIRSELERSNVYIVSCYITRSSGVEPRRLHNVPEQHWESGARFLYDLSSFIPTSLITRTIFIKNGWKIDIDNNETRLFMHVNHPDHLTDVCRLARNAVCCEDSLSDLLLSTSLDIYINQQNLSFTARDQGQELTCYAHAAATVLHLSMHRILGREGGYPEFETLRDDMIERYGRRDANTLCVLQEVCPRYRLHCKKVNVREAMEAITEKHQVLARFWLTDEEWGVFDKFYECKGDGILTKRDLDISKRIPYTKTFGHAVVLTSFNSECLRLMNSYGDGWGDQGFFKVENAEVLGFEFIDVYWSPNDLTRREKDYYDQHGAGVADKLMKSLKALQNATYTCPRCGQNSNVNEFKGTMLRVQCPRCGQEFSCHDGMGNMLALNMYLTSLSKQR